MSNDQKEEIIRLRNNKYPKAKLFQSVLDKSKFKIKILPLNI